MAEQKDGGALEAPHACHCIGPQNGQPLCPCQMRGVQVKNGRYVMPERDLGPVPDPRTEQAIKDLTYFLAHRDREK